MTLHEQIRQDAVTALRTHNTFAREKLNFTLSLLDNQAKQRGEVVLPDPEAINLLRKYVEKIDALETQATQAGREDRSTELFKEQVLLTKYLPPALDPVALEDQVTKALEEWGLTSVKQIGQAMQQLLHRLPGADRKVVSGLVRNYLKNKEGAPT